MKNGLYYNLGRLSFKEAWEFQKKLVEKRKLDEIPDTLLLVEHPPTYTLGKGGDPKHMLADERVLKEIGAEFVPIDRGGDITFHGPGQLVAYPILNLREHKLDVHQYLRQLEETTIDVLKEYRVESVRVKGLTGVWVDDAKIAAIGVRLSRWVSMHGIAINVNTDLNYFKYIVPCGISSKPVTSLKELCGKEIGFLEFLEKFVIHFEKCFNLSLKEEDFTPYLPKQAVLA